jgi:hypothetical protein
LDRKNVHEIVRQSVHAAVFSTLCVLDGVAAIESTPEKGERKLEFAKDGKSVALNGPRTELLHDLYQRTVQDEVFGE